MTATLSRKDATEHAVYTVERLTDPQQIRPLLEPERAYAAYAVAQLEPERLALAEWYAGAGPSGSALLLHSRSGLGHALFTMGDVDALDALLSLHPGPHFTFGSLRQEHRRVIEKYFMVTRRQEMLRMAVTAAGFAPVAGPAVRLQGRDIIAINRLYSAEGGPTAYRREHIDDGVYYGVIEEGTLVSIAGTHVVSVPEGVAVVGNVFTHPRHRGRGLGTVATSAVTADLLRRCADVVLTVEAANEPAVAIYRRLGYETQCRLHETPLIRREPVGAISLLRRLAAAWRGRADGKEVVVR